MRVPFGRQALDGVVVGLAETTEVPAERLVTPTRGAARTRCRRSWSSSRCGWRTSTARRRRGRSRSCCRRRAAADRAVGGADGRAARRRAADRQPARAARRRCRASPGGDLRRAAAARGARARRDRAARPAPGAADRRARRPRGRADRRAGGGGRRGRRRAARTCCTASPAPARPRSTCARRRRRSSAGEGVIVLVPEIALTPQTVGRFRRASATPSRCCTPRSARASATTSGGGCARARRAIAVGPRSAVFAPVRDLGLIVVDEEHDPSYKHEGDPRYDARHVARGADAARSGGALPRRLGDAAAGDVAAAAAPDAAGARRQPAAAARARARHARRAPPAAPETRRALTEARKAILLLNRRGWSNFLTCRTCGKVWECPQCDVALVLHRAEHVVACHHCGHRERVPGALRRVRLAVGRPLRRRHRAARGRAGRGARRAGVPARRRHGRARRTPCPALLARFAAAPAGLLIGTQMVAKGHDFPDVTLGVVVDADATLRFPDFRAEERTFALIAQLAGRAGRGPRGGRVLVQTTAPDAPAIVAAARHDTRGLRDRRARAAARARLPAVRRPDPGRSARPRPPAAPRAAAGEIADAAAGAPRRDRARPGAAVPPARPPPLPGRGQGARPRRRRSPRCASAVDRAANAREHRDVAFSVDVDPQ